MIKNWTPLLLLLPLLSACSNWALRERCEKTNWFEYSRDLANNGKYLEEDSFVKDCKKEELASAVQLDLGFKSGRDRYCTYENFFKNGEQGEIVNYRMCDGLVMYNMQERYASGIKNYCTEKVGYQVGASGKIYKNVCFKNIEPKFLPSYYKGRKEYLTKQIEQFNEAITKLSALNENLNVQIEIISREVRALPFIQSCSTTSRLNPETKEIDKSTHCEEDWHIRNQRSRLESNISLLRDSYNTHARIITKSSEGLNEARAELTKIPVEI